MIEVNFMHEGKLLTVLNFYFRINNGDTILVDSILYEVIDAGTIDIKKHKNGDVSVEQNATVRVIF